MMMSLIKVHSTGNVNKFIVAGLTNIEALGGTGHSQHPDHCQDAPHPWSSVLVLTPKMCFNSTFGISYLINTNVVLRRNCNHFLLPKTFSGI